MTKKTKLELACALKDIELKDCGAGHFQLHGPLLVNYYPNSKNKSAYIAGTKKAAKHVTPEQAVEMCFNAPEAQGGLKDKRSGGSREKRKKLLNKVKNCYWCKTRLTLDTSTLEHIIPLSRGGLDNSNNLTLACYTCNNDRGSEMPELAK